MNNQSLGRKAIKEPLCGWEFFHQHLHDIIPNEIVIISDKVKFTIKTNDNRVANKAIAEITRK